MNFATIGILLFTLFAGVAQSLILSDLQIHPFIIMLNGFLIGLFLPGIIYKWIYKEEIERLKSQEDEES